MQIEAVRKGSVRRVGLARTEVAKAWTYVYSTVEDRTGCDTVGQPPSNAVVRILVGSSWPVEYSSEGLRIFVTHTNINNTTIYCGAHFKEKIILQEARPHFVPLFRHIIRVIVLLLWWLRPFKIPGWLRE